MHYFYQVTLIKSLFPPNLLEYADQNQLIQQNQIRISFASLMVSGAGGEESRVGALPRNN